MSENIKPSKVKKGAKWDAVQRIGFWAMIIIPAAFWFGVYCGNTAAVNAQNERDSIKTQAIQEYQASLKAEK